MKRKAVVRVILILLVAVLILSYVQNFFTYSVDPRNHYLIANFYKQPKDSLDAVYIGASNVYSSWLPPIGWHESGIAVYPFCCGYQPYDALPYMIKEAHKVQPNALLIVCLSHFFLTSVTDQAIHYSADSLPWSKNKVEMIMDLTTKAGYSGWERAEFFFPLIRYHSRWNELKEKDFVLADTEPKGAPCYSQYLRLDKGEDITENFERTLEALKTGERKELNENQLSVLESVLDYCDQERLNVLFTTNPIALSADQLAKLNTLLDTVEQRGYRTLNMVEYLDELQLDPVTDYYNPAHTNLHGGLKATRCLTNYLRENYDFTDKRGDPAYSSWDASYDEYLEIIKPYLFANELADEPPSLPELPYKDMISSEEYGGWIGNQGIWIDRCNEYQPGHTTEIVIDPADEALEIVGWAPDFWNKAPLSALYLQVGETVIQCDYGIERSGVAEKYGSDKMMKVGFKVLFPISLITDGNVREISFIGVSADGEYLYTPVTYQLSYIRELKALPELPYKDMISSEEYGGWIGNQGIWIDRCNEYQPGHTTEIVVNFADETLEIVGWAPDFWNKAPLSALYLQVGETFLQCDYGIERTGVVEKYGEENMLKVGFDVTFPTALLADSGVQELSFIGVSADGQYLYTPVTYQITGDRAKN